MGLICFSMGREYSCRKESRASVYLRHDRNEKNIDLAENTTINPRWCMSSISSRVLLQPGCAKVSSFILYC
eukprot:scaffold55923_cov25-Cyclotella_meneghiniana.AAC.1